MLDLITKLKTISQLLTDKKWGEAVKLSGQVMEEFGDLITQLLGGGQHALMAMSPQQATELDACCTEILAKCHEVVRVSENRTTSLPVGSVDPATLIMLIQGVIQAIQMFRNWRNS